MASDDSGAPHEKGSTPPGPGTQGNDAQTNIANEQQVAQAPFDKADSADAIIKTSDGVSFFIPKIILSLVSPYFQDVFKGDPAVHAAPPKLELIDSKDTQRDSIIPAMTTYSILETSKVFGTVLKYFYPGQAAPQLTRISDLAPVLTAMVEYRMQSTAPFQAVIASLLDIAEPLTMGEAHPAVIRVFALFHGFRDAIPIASMKLVKLYSLRIALEHISTSQCSELDQIPASALVELMKYHHTCHSAIRTHAPSFNTWREGSSQLKFKCSSQTKSGKREVLTVAKVDDLYRHLLKAYEHCPLGLINSISAVTMLERNLKCKGCSYPCNGMRSALNKIYKNEVEAALETVDARRLDQDKQLSLGASGGKGSSIAKALAKCPDEFLVKAILCGASIQKPIVIDLRKLGVGIVKGDTVEDSPDALATHSRDVDTVIITTAPFQLG
ncbi:hypothetical protein AAF712_007378 [Marasmius tenuissimus]|uniref:BTB domain-containing protein n=1 Tax=Marasmius tenuissimus TaxID=585030 RepID=A0ABR2ZWA2_9AGAR